MSFGSQYLSKERLDFRMRESVTPGTRETENLCTRLYTQYTDDVHTYIDMYTNT